MTEQQIDAALSRYEPDSWGGRWEWMRAGSRAARFRLPNAIFDELAGGFEFGINALRASYPTREAAFADLRQAIIASGTAAGGGT